MASWRPRPAPDGLASLTEASGHLVGSPVFKTGGSALSVERGSIPCASADRLKTLTYCRFPHPCSSRGGEPIGETEDLVSVRCPSSVRLRSDVHLIHGSGEGLLIRREEMPITIEGHLNRRVSEMALDSFRVGSGRDEKRRTGVTQVV